MKLRNDMAVYCENKEEAIKFLNKCVESKFKWSSGEFIWPLKDADERFDEPGTYYFIHNNLLSWSNNITSIFRDYKNVNFKDLFKEDNMKFKIGDKVRIRKDLVGGRYYNGVLYIDDMYIDDICEITAVSKTKYYVNAGWGYSEEMLEGVENKMNKCKIYEMPNYVRNEVKKVIINEPCVIVFLISGEKGVAKCCPEDEFDENIGYSIALHRARIEKNKNDMCRNNEFIKQYIKIQDNFKIMERKIEELDKK